jgi:hypothetical protein
MENARKKVNDSCCQKDAFEGSVVHDVIRSARRINQELDKLVGDLEKVRVALHTAVQRAAQTMRSQTTKREQLIEKAKGSRKAVDCGKELHQLLSSGHLSELVENKSALEKKLAYSTKALDAQVWTRGVAQLDLSMETGFVAALGTLNESLSVLRKLTAELVCKSAVAEMAEQVSFRLHAHLCVAHHYACLEYAQTISAQPNISVFNLIKPLSFRENLKA